VERSKLTADRLTKINKFSANPELSKREQTPVVGPAHLLDKRREVEPSLSPKRGAREGRNETGTKEGSNNEDYEGRKEATTKTTKRHIDKSSIWPPLLTEMAQTATSNMCQILLLLLLPIAAEHQPQPSDVAAMPAVYELLFNGCPQGGLVEARENFGSLELVECKALCNERRA
jgi:hypothetical protein